MTRRRCPTDNDAADVKSARQRSGADATHAAKTSRARGAGVRRNEEEQIQAAVVLHLHVRAMPGVVWWHTPNGGYRNATEAGRFKALGVKAGIPDLIALRAGQLFAIELKAPGGRVSEAQREMLAALEQAGAKTAVAFGLDDALDVLERWGVIRPRSGQRAAVMAAG